MFTKREIDMNNNNLILNAKNKKFNQPLVKAEYHIDKQ